MYGMTGILGLGLIAAPFVFRYTTNPAALWTSIILGVAIALVSGIQAMLRDEVDWEYFVTALLGAGAVVSPFIFGFRGLTPAFWSEIVLGLAVAALSAYKVFEDHARRTSHHVTA